MHLGAFSLMKEPDLCVVEFTGHLEQARPWGGEASVAAEQVQWECLATQGTFRCSRDWGGG